MSAAVVVMVLFFLRFRVSASSTSGEWSGVEGGHHVLDARVVLHAVHGEVLAVAGLLEAAVRHFGGKQDVGVDPHGTEVQVTAQPHGSAVVGGPDTGRQGVVHVVGHGYCLFFGAELLDGNDGAEGFLLHHVVRLLGTGDDGGFEEVALLPRAVAAGFDPAVGRQVLHHGGHGVEVVHVVQRAEVVLFVVLRACVQGPGVFHHGGHDVVVHGILHQDAGDGRAV